MPFIANISDKNTTDYTTDGVHTRRSIEKIASDRKNMFGSFHSLASEHKFKLFCVCSIQAWKFKIWNTLHTYTDH